MIYVKEISTLKEEHYYGIKLSEDSLNNAAKWKESELAKLNELSMVSIGYSHLYREVTNLVKLRLYEIKEVLETNNIKPEYWFVSNEIKRTNDYNDIWEVSNPFISRKFLVAFSDSKITSFGFRSDTKNFIETQNLYEAISKDRG